jgi:hypothetical protein
VRYKSNFTVVSEVDDYHVKIYLRNKKNIISSISVTDIVFDYYLGNGIIELFPK